MAVEIIFEFHSTSTDNEAGVASGWRDPPLSTKGRELAKELGERRQGEQIDAVFCSDLRRAIHQPRSPLAEVSASIPTAASASTTTAR